MDRKAANEESFIGDPERERQRKEEPSTAATGKDAESAIQESTSEDSVTENGSPVNKRFSFGEEKSGSQIADELRQLLNSDVSVSAGLL